MHRRSFLTPGWQLLGDPGRSQRPMRSTASWILGLIATVVNARGRSAYAFASAAKQQCAVRRLVCASTRVAVGSALATAWLCFGIVGCSRRAENQALVVATNLAEVAEGELKITDEQSKELGKWKLGPRSCLCDWQAARWEGVCGFTSAAVLLPKGRYAFVFFDSAGVPKCSIALEAGASSVWSEKIVVECDPDHERVLRRAFLCAYLDGSGKARRFVERAVHVGTAETVGVAKRLLEAWETPQELSEAYLVEGQDLGVGDYGPERKPARDGVEAVVEVNPDGEVVNVEVHQGSGIAELDQRASHQLASLIFVPALATGQGAVAGRAGWQWTSSKVSLRVPVWWQPTPPIR